jgi:pyrroloquinoline quinone biosynthesis protein D
VSESAASEEQHPAFSGKEQPRLNPMFMFRWEESQNSHVLLYPEGVVKLNGSAGEIIGRCDGQRSIEQIVAELKTTFATGGDGAEIENGVHKFMETAHAKGWLVV